MTSAPFYGWVVVGAASSVLFMAYGAQFSFGVFFSALLEEFGWSRAALSGVFSLYAFGYGTLAFVSGGLTDRWGPRVVIATGGLFLGAGWIAMSFTRTLWQPYLFYGVIAALGMSTAFVPCGATVARWFVRRRGLAAGIASAGGSLGAFALAPLAQFLVSTLGWRWAYAIFGTAILVMLNVLAPLLKRDPETMGLTPDGEASRSSVSGGVTFLRLGRRPVPSRLHDEAGPAQPRLLGAPRPLHGHVDSRVQSAGALGAPGAGPRHRAYACGHARERTRYARHRRARHARHALRSRGAAAGPRPQPGSAGGGLPRIRRGGLAAWPLRGRDPLRLLYGAIGALFPAVVADFFDRGHAGGLVGLLFAMSGSMSAWGPLGAGFIYDRTGSYGPAWVASAALNVVALGLLHWARPPRRLEHLSLEEA